TIYAPSPQGNATFTSWSDGGAQQHDVTIGTSDVAYIAAFSAALTATPTATVAALATATPTPTPTAGLATATPTPTGPPTISNVQAAGITQTVATITWTTNKPADSQVDYGRNTHYGSSSPLDASLVTSHSQQLSGLA